PWWPRTRGCHSAWTLPRCLFILLPQPRCDSFVPVLVLSHKLNFAPKHALPSDGPCNCSYHCCLRFSCCRQSTSDRVRLCHGADTPTDVGHWAGGSRGRHQHHGECVKH